MRRWNFIMGIIALPLFAPGLLGQGWIEPLPDRPAWGVEKVRTAVHVTVRDRVALVEVEEWFRNNGGGLGEGDYLYPLPGEAVFSNFSLFQGDEELRGETMAADEARRIYEEIVRKKRDPALIELVGHGLVRARVFPINPGETRKITMRYTQVMDRAGDALQFRYAAGGRNAGSRPAPSEPGATQPTAVISDAPLSFELEVEDGAMFRDPFSPTHQVRVDRRDGRLRVRPDGTLRGRFALFLPFAEERVGVTLATHRPSSGEPGYFMLTLSPGDADGDALPRDVTVVLDVSGSMSGAKLEQAKAALRQLLSSLNRNDRYRLIAFNNAVRTHRPEWSSATTSAIRDGRNWVDGLVASGGTNIAAALEEAFAVTSPRDRLGIVLFMTDGLPSVGEENPDRIAATAASRRGTARVFAFGVGYDVNTYLLDRLTAEAHGTTQYVEPGEDVEEALSTLAAKIQHPVLSDLTIDRSPVRLSEIYPEQLPDLFAGEELIVFGRYQAARRDRDGGVVIRGERNGRTERFATDASFPTHELGNDFIPRLWASRKLGFLTRTLRLEGHSPALEEEIRETAMRYGLLSEYTSYLVQEPNVVASNVRRQRGGRALDQLSANRVPGRLSGTVASNAPAMTVTVSGERAVKAAEDERRRREVRSVSELNEMDDRLAPRDTDGRFTRRAHGRQFVLRDGVWSDVSHSDTVRIVNIEPYSEAYFALLRLAPELERWFSEFEHVLVAGQRASIRVTGGGETRMRGADLALLVRDFRGK